MVRVQDYGILCQVCYELLRNIREDQYWLKHQARFRLDPSADSRCGCFGCHSPKATEQPKPYGLPDGYSE
jgi:hypothetical protein